jgi:hypothetical protein
LKPGWLEALSNMGESLRLSGSNFDEAVAVQRQALAQAPNDPGVRALLGNALLGAKRFEEAEEVFRALIDEDPTALLPHINLGNVYREMGRAHDAIDMFEKALSLAPSAHEGYANIGAVFAERGWSTAAFILHKKALSYQDLPAKAHLNFGILALSLGHFDEAWKEYEYRFDSPDEHIPRRSTPPAYWAGESLDNKSILVWTEQGIGDEVIYSSMIPDLIARAQRCAIACSHRMTPVFTRSFPTCQILTFKVSAVELGPQNTFDYQIAAASLGKYFRTSFKSFANAAPYLKADAAKSAILRERYRNLAPGKKIIGISWRGGGTSGKEKSAVLRDFAPLLNTPETFFVNLQYGDCRAEIASVRAETGIEIFEDAEVDPLQDIDTFFAQVAAMDLVITTSNSTAHVAGSIGAPTWVLLPLGKGTLGYWFQRRTDSPWYPSVRLIRQQKRETDRPWWTPLVAEAAQMLADQGKAAEARE